ncbi:MAG TPA: YCF48-related protein, partial [Candidatus Kapabacteria bacterium]|nr:YCF48-related protein [Candidatus Kapabacteria bacterium]
MRYILIYILTVVGSVAYGQDFWQATNGPIGGDAAISSIALDSRGILYAASLYGFYRSTNEGVEWTKLGDNIDGNSVNAMVVNQRGEVLAGTQGGMYRSTDEGISWSFVDDVPAATTVDQLVIAHNIVIALSEPNRMYISSDDGDSWTIDTIAGMGKYIERIAIGPEGDIYAATWGDGVFHSSDNSFDWEQFDTLQTTPYVGAIGVNAAGEIYIGASQVGLCRSVDGGKIWQFVGLQDNGMDIIYPTQQGTIFIVTFTNYGYYFQEDVLRTTDDGGDWDTLHNGLNEFYFHSIVCDSITGAVYAGNYNGVYRLQNNAWKFVSPGMGLPSVASLLVNNEGSIVAGTDNGIFESTDRGDHWDTIGLPGINIS